MWSITKIPTSFLSELIISKVDWVFCWFCCCCCYNIKSTTIFSANSLKLNFGSALLLTLSLASRKRTYVVLVSTGSFNPPTYMHLRCFGTYYLTSTVFLLLTYTHFLFSHHSSVSTSSRPQRFIILPSKSQFVIYFDTKNIAPAPKIQNQRQWNKLWWHLVQKLKTASCAKSIFSGKRHTFSIYCGWQWQKWRRLGQRAMALNTLRAILAQLEHT